MSDRQVDTLQNAGGEEHGEEEDECQLPVNTNPSPPFSMLITNLLQPLSKDFKKYCISLRKGPKEVRNIILTRFFKSWREKVGPNLYPALRLIMPSIDRERQVYGLKEKAVASVLVRLLHIPRISKDAKLLMDYKVGAGSGATTGDFSAICCDIIAKRSTNIQYSKLTVDEVNDVLDELSLVSGIKEQTEVLSRFYQVMSPEELQWIIQMILKDVRIGCGEKVIFDNYHADANAFFNVTSSLKKVCSQLYDPEYRLPDEVNQITLMSCFQPQLAQYVKPDANRIVELLKPNSEGGFAIEEKMDGERIQIHISDYGKHVKFFSRAAKDYTYLYGSSYDDPNGSIVKHFKDAFSPKMRNCILDGEMVVWDSQENMVVPFGTLKMAAKSVQELGASSILHPLYMAFDIILVNDKLLVDYSLKERKAALAAVLTPKQGYVEILPFTIGTAAEDISTMFDKALERGAEGLIVKDLRARYVVSERSKVWIKLKPDYVDELGETLDLCIVGGIYGSGARSGKLGSFLCGLREKDKDEKFISFCRVGGGFTAQDFATIRNITANKWHKYDTNNPPSNYLVVGSGQPPDVWIRPSDSIVIEVKGAQITDSNTFPAKKTLRFPRFRRFRHDEKDWQTAMSLADLDDLILELLEDTGADDTTILPKKHLTSLDPVGHMKKKLRTQKRIFQGDNEALTEVEPESQLLSGIAFLVPDDIHDPKRMSKSDLEVLLKRHGGRIVQSLKSAVQPLVIADRLLLHVTSIISRSGATVVRPAWVFESISEGSLPDIEPYVISPVRDESNAVKLDRGKEKVEEEPDPYQSAESGLSHYIKKESMSTASEIDEEDLKDGIKSEPVNQCEPTEHERHDEMADDSDITDDNLSIAGLEMNQETPGNEDLSDKTDDEINE